MSDQPVDEIQARCNPSDPAGRHALVTGGGRGIGAAVARALTAAGAVVTVLGRGAEALAALVAEGAAAGGEAADVTDPAGFAAALARAEAARGPLDILVNNAGGVATAPFARLDRADWDRMIALNLTSVFTATQAVLPGLQRRGWGRVVNIASTAGLAGYPYVVGLCRRQARRGRADPRAGAGDGADRRDGERGLPGLYRHAHAGRQHRQRGRSAPAAAPMRCAQACRAAIRRAGW